MANKGSGITLPELNIREGLDADVLNLVAKGDTALVMAEKVAALAKAIAPVETGRYRDGIKAEKTELGARVIATDQKSTWIEFGIPSRNHEGQFVLRRAAEAVGLKFVRRNNGSLHT